MFSESRWRKSDFDAADAFASMYWHLPLTVIFDAAEATVLMVSAMTFRLTLDAAEAYMSMHFENIVSELVTRQAADASMRDRSVL